LAVKVPDKGPAVQEVLRALDADAIVATSLAIREPTLDDVFLQLTGHRAGPGPGNLGLVAKSAEAAGAAAFPITALLTFPSSAFVATASLPGPLRAYADHQPLTATVNAIRPLLLGGPTATHAVAAILWCVGIIAVFAPLAVLRYRRAA
jgi:hypothetical protein